MESNVKYQQGYLLIVALVLIVVISFAGLMLVQMFVGQTESSTNVFQSKRALYLAISGLEIAKRDIVVNGVECDSITGSAKYTDASLLNGKFTVTGAYTAADTTLASSINSGSIVIDLVDASEFADIGIVKIGSEYIAYERKVGNILSELTRGKIDSVISDHDSGDSVYQDQCLLIAMGGVPTIADSTSSKRVVKSTLVSGGGHDVDIDGHKAVIGGNGNVELFNGAELANPEVNKSSSDYAGSIMYINGNAVIKDSSKTSVASEANPSELETSSTEGDIQPDVQENQTLSTSVLEELYFDKTESELRDLADQDWSGNEDSSTLDGIKGKIIWTDDNLIFSGSSTTNIGTADEPVILLMKGNFEMKDSSNVNFYGFLFTWGNIYAKDSTGSFNGFGAMGTYGNLTMDGSNKKFTYSSDVVSGAFGLISGGSYIAQNIGVQEVFH